MYTSLKKTLFEKLGSFKILYREDQKLFKNLAVFDFESICVEEETYKETETTKWIGKHNPISVSVSSNLIAEPIFFAIQILDTLCLFLSVPLKAWQRKAKHK